MGIEVTRIERYVRNYDRRMAFHFGNVVASESSHQFLELILDVNGERADGLSMSGMTPIWFLKDPDRPLCSLLLNGVGSLGCHSFAQYGRYHAHYGHHYNNSAVIDTASIV